MKKEILLTDWNRKEHYNFFSQLEEPFFGLVTNLDCTQAYQKAKDEKISFFLYYLYQSLSAANKIENFRYRIEEDAIYSYDVIHASPTIFREDTTFGFSFMPYHHNFPDFLKSACLEMENVKAAGGLCLNETTSRPDVIHYSAIPWVSFTGLTLARSFSYNDCIPKISFGKMFKEQNKWMMPVSITVHHGLADGYHVGQFVETFQTLLNK